MYPNTLPLYSGAYDTQTGKHAKAGDAVRISDDNQTGVFNVTLSGGNRLGVMVQHNVQDQKLPRVAIDRHTLKISSTKVNEASGAEDTALVSFQVAAPRRSFTNEELIALVNALLNTLLNPAASEDQWCIGGVTDVSENVQALLSGAI